MKVHFAESSYKVDNAFKNQYVAKIKAAYKEASAILSFGSKHINFFVQPRTYGLIKETHDTATTFNSEFITIAFDPKFAETHPKQLIDQVPASVYHEINHAARFHKGIWHESFLDKAILEGLATVFEREYAHSDPLWGKYPKNANNWLTEILKLGDKVNHNHYMFMHPDGRRWIGYKVGTYTIDQALKKSGKDITELTQMQCADILKLLDLDTLNTQT